MKIKYVGKKDAETAFSAETGITWTPGAEHDIPSLSLCKRMLNHPDVFEPVVEEQAPAAETSTEGAKGLSDAPNKTEAPAGDDKPAEGAAKLLMQTTAGVLDLSLLTKDQLHALAKEQGMSIHPNAKAETVAAKLAETFPVAAEGSTSTEGGN